MPRATYAELVGQGCLCGSEIPHDRCPIHTGQSDNRGIRAFFEAGMPQAFPSSCTCAVCGADSLMYPSVDLENGDVDVNAPGYSYERTVICPNCSTPYLEARLRAKCEANGYGHGRLNSKRVFGTAKAVEAGCAR